jgi:L-arabinose isomerase
LPRRSIDSNRFQHGAAPIEITSSRRRIGLVAPYFRLFDEAMPPEFRADRERHAARLETLLSRHGDVLYSGLTDSEEEGDALGRRLSAEGVDLLVIAPPMAAPPSYVRALLSHLPGCPLVVVAAQDHGTVPDGYDTTEATRRSLPVGYTMVTNVLVRDRRPFLSVVGSFEESGFEARLGTAVTSAVAASAIRDLRLLRVGEPIDGYDDVIVSDEDLGKLAVDIVDVSPTRLTAVFEEIAANAVEAQIAADQQDYDTTAVDEETHRRSARLTCALRSLVDEFDVAGGTVNCHGGHLRWNEGVGITACLAVARLSEAGRPFSCTGDLPAALALVLARQVAPAALYCELYQLDFEGDWLLVANGGEGDTGLCREGSTVRLLPEDHYEGLHGAGTAVAYEIAPGPSTIMSLTPMPHTSSGWRLIAAEGEIVDSRHRRMEGPNGMFSFLGTDVRSGYTEWAQAGASHHAVLVPGHHAVALEGACRLIQIDFVSITG